MTETKNEELNISNKRPADLILYHVLYTSYYAYKSWAGYYDTFLNLISTTSFLSPGPATKDLLPLPQAATLWLQEETNNQRGIYRLNNKRMAQRHTYLPE